MCTVQLLKDRTEASGQKKLEGQVEEVSFCALPFLSIVRGGCGWSLQVTQTLLEKAILLGPESL